MTQFNFTFDPNVSLEQRVGFEMAAAIWSQLLNDDVSLNLRIGATNELGENGQAVGGAIPIFHDTHYGTYQQYLEADATTAEDDQVVDALQQGNTVDVTVDGEVIDGNTELMLTRAQAKALGMDEALVLEDGSTWDRDVLANPDGLDGYILINDSFDWHYDLTREADAPEGTLDFLTMALHEIGHSLGFVSGLDGLIDTFTMHSGEQRTEGITALDLMRHADGDGIADLTFGDAAYFSIDGGQTSLAEFEEGNEYQASHWQRYQDALGIMDPTLGYQERTDISNLDLTALDAIGWDVDYDALANGLDLNALYDQAQQTVAGTFGVDVAAVETALTNGEDWQSLGYEAWFNAFKDQVMEQGWGTWFQDFEAQVLEQGWGTWFQNFEAQMLEQGWGTWFQSFEGEMLNQSWGTWFQSFDETTLNQSWGTWFQDFDSQVLEQGWGTWFQQFEGEALEQGWGTWFQEQEAQLLEQGWGTWFQEVDNQLLEQGWGTWFQKFESQVLEQGWGTWFQQIEGHSETVNGAAETLAGTDDAMVAGSQGDDILAGGQSKDWVNAGDGDDLVDGKAGDDVIFGDRGNDILYGWTGEDLIFGGVGDDFIAGENDNDQLYGEAGHDILSGGRGDDHLDGGTGQDVLRGDTGNDVLAGGSGNDQLDAGSGDDLVVGGAGKDDINGGSGDDVLYGDDLWAAQIPTEGLDTLPENLPVASPTVDVSEALAELDFRMRLEAEDMKLKNYNLDEQASASGGSLIKTQGDGKAETTFNGPDGTYDLVVGYNDQAGATSEITLEIKDGRKTIAEHTILLNGSTGAGTYKIAGVSLEDGYKIKIEGEAEGGDLARLDYLDILTAGGTAENFYTFVGAGASNATTRIEAEAMDLEGSYQQRNDSLASGDKVIAATGRGNGTATYTYTGAGGVYNLYANYFDSTGGQAEAEVLLNGEKLSSWTFNLDDNSTHERTIGLGVTLKQGDEIEIQGEKDGGDQAIIDYLVLEDAATADMSISGSGVIRVEAEHMALTGPKFKVENKSFASGGALVKTDDKKGGSLTATTTFTGDTGLYNIVIGYYDLEDGRAEYSATLAGQTLDSWVANRDIEDDLDESATTRILSNVLLNTGDTFSLQSIRDDDDKGYIDYVEFVAVNAPDTWQLEVEQMDLAGKYGVKSEDFVSSRGFVETGDDVIGFTGTGLFRGETGYYDVVVGYYDSNKGAAEIAIKVDNTELDRWYADQNLGSDKPETQNFVTRTVAQGIKIDQFDLIELTGIEDNGDKANLDYIQFIKVEPPAEPEPVAEAEVDPDSDNGDVIRGGSGNDTAYGGEGDDTLYGDDEQDNSTNPGNDLLVGGVGNDTLKGGAGNDILIGSDATAQGSLEIDTLNGGSGADRFILGDVDHVYYGTGGSLDYAVITDFTVGIDQLQLHGSASDYHQSVQGSNVHLYSNFGQDLIAKFENITLFDLGTNATFV